MRSLVLCAVVLLASACDKHADVVQLDKPHHREDRRDPDPAPTAFTIAVELDGAGSAQTWTEQDLATLPKIDGAASDGEARETWPLRAVVAAKLGPTARVTEVRGDTIVPLSAGDWADASKTPVVHTTRRGTLKFRWADTTGKWGPTIVKDVVGLAVTTK